MKKILALMLTVVLVFSFASCKNNAPDNNTEVELPRYDF